MKAFNEAKQNIRESREMEDVMNFITDNKTLDELIAEFVRLRKEYAGNTIVEIDYDGDAFIEVYFITNRLETDEEVAERRAYYDDQMERERRQKEQQKESQRLVAQRVRNDELLMLKNLAKKLHIKLPDGV